MWLGGGGVFVDAMRIKITYTNGISGMRHASTTLDAREARTVRQPDDMPINFTKPMPFHELLASTYAHMEIYSAGWCRLELLKSMMAIRNFLGIIRFINS